MEKVNKFKLIEVITDIVTVKIAESVEKGYYDVRFNLWFEWIGIKQLKFDGKKFYTEEYDEEAKKAFMIKDKEEELKLNRPRTKAEEADRALEMMKMPIYLQELKVIYRKTPTEPIVDMVLYINELIWQ